MARAGQLEPVLVWLEPVNKSRSTRAGPCMARAGPCMTRAGPCMAKQFQTYKHNQSECCIIYVAVSEEE